MTAEPLKKLVSHSQAQVPPSNRVHEFREELGLSKVDLGRLANLSEKTIARIERQQKGFRTVTYRRVLNGLNRMRRREGHKELSFEDVFPI
jgi:DNA-binding XRE family transcriptional regulator